MSQPLNLLFVEGEFGVPRPFVRRGGAKGADVGSNSHDFLPSGLRSGMGRDRQIEPVVLLTPALRLARVPRGNCGKEVSN